MDDELLWDKVVEYCVNDVIGTEATFEDRKEDFTAREILGSIFLKFGGLSNG